MTTYTSQKNMRKCQFCDSILAPSTPAERPVCKAIECLHKWQRLQHKNHLEQERQKKMQLEQELTKLLKLHTKDDHAPVLCRTPSQNGTNVAVSSKRREAHANHLQRLIDTFEDSNFEPAYTAPHRLLKEPPTSQLLTAACGNCQGSCCTQGYKFNAFIDHFTLKKVEDHNSTQDMADIKQQYMNHIPELNIEDSCIYHTSDGCSLDVSLRAPICGDFYCEGLRALASNDHQISVDRVLFVSLDDQSIVNTSLIENLPKVF
jgi:hypothetical protein